MTDAGPLESRLFRLCLLLQLAFAWPSYALSGKRFQDRNKPASFALIGIGLGLVKALLDVIGLTGNPFAPGILDTIFSVAMIIVGLVYAAVMTFRTLGGEYQGRDREGLTAAALFWYVTTASMVVIWYVVFITK